MEDTSWQLSGYRKPLDFKTVSFALTNLPRETYLGSTQLDELLSVGMQTEMPAVSYSRLVFTPSSPKKPLGAETETVSLRRRDAWISSLTSSPQGSSRNAVYALDIANCRIADIREYALEGWIDLRLPGGTALSTDSRPTMVWRSLPEHR